jgi:hypothetical protein
MSANNFNTLHDLRAQKEIYRATMLSREAKMASTFGTLKKTIPSAMALNMLGRRLVGPAWSYLPLVYKGFEFVQSEGFSSTLQQVQGGAKKLGATLSDRAGNALRTVKGWFGPKRKALPSPHTDALAELGLPEDEDLMAYREAA